jgi:pSer/pThr/pTyr-binding forkhead associated (FHA) protein
MKTIKIGRNPDNDIVINDESRTVSGHHVILKVSDNGTLTICDSSTNGTYINGVKAEKNGEVPVKKGDEIRLGPHVIFDWSLVIVPSSDFNATEIDTNEKATYTIGTASDNQIVISDSTNHVSRHHAILKLKANGNFYIYDQSTNGTYVNGVKVKTRVDFQVKPSDTISFANIRQFDWTLVTESSIPIHTSYKPNPIPPRPTYSASQEMFRNPFDFEGRIRRTEYGISTIVYAVIALIVNLIGSNGGFSGIIFLAYFPLLWFCLAQNTKRCHDRGNSGWYQLIPLYGLWLLFGDSDPGNNQYGINPKGIN